MWRVRAVHTAAGGEESRLINAEQWKRIAHVADCESCQRAHRRAIGMAGFGVIDCLIPQRTAEVIRAAEQAFKLAEDHRRRRAASDDGHADETGKPVEAPPAMMKPQPPSIVVRIIFPANAPLAYKAAVNWAARMLLRALRFKRAVATVEE